MPYRLKHWMDGQTNELPDGWMVRQMDRHLDQLDEWTDSRMDGRKNRLTHVTYSNCDIACPTLFNYVNAVMELTYYKLNKSVKYDCHFF